MKNTSNDDINFNFSSVTETEYTTEDINNPPVILLYGEINDEMITEASAVLISEQYNSDKPEKIKVFLNSPGGDLHPAFAFIELMKASSIPIETYALGQCVSAALFIFMAGSKGNRIVTKTCSAMSHTYSTGVDGSHWDIQDVQKELKNVQEKIINHYMEYTGLPKATIMSKLIGKGDHWLKPEDLVKYNLADKVGQITFD